jgi:hypothetical protein
VADAEQSQVLNNFVAERPGPDHEDAGVTQAGLVPPFDGFEPRETAGAGFRRCWD